MVEGNETFTVGLTVSETSLSITATATATGTITNDDGAVVTVNNAEASEGDDITFTVTLGAAVQGGLTVTPGFTDVTAVEGTDYEENTTALSFTGTKGETKTFTVSTTEDVVLEADETFTVGLSVSNSSVTATDTGTGTIDNDDSAAVTINDAGADEGDAMTFTVTLDTAVQDGLKVTPDFTDGTAVEGTDYTANTTVLTFTGTANETKTFTVQTTEDAVLEADETFTVGLSVSDAPAGVTATDTGTGTIDNDDGSGVIVDDVAASEGESMTFTVTLTEAVQGGLTVTPGFTNGTASSADYTENTTPLNFTGTANETQTFTVSTTEDRVREGNETFSVDLTVSGTSLDVTDDDTGTGTIIDDDNAPSVNLSVAPASVGEGDGATSVTVTATFSNATIYATAKTVTVSVGDGSDSATSGTDYAEVADFDITVPAGASDGSATFTLTPTQDTLVEGDETIAVSGTNGARTVNGASLTLTDDDSVTAANLVIDLSVDPASVTEDAGATTVTVTAEFSTVVTYATDTTVTVRVGAGGDSATSGTDYAAVADFTVTIPAGRTSGSAPFALTPTDDTLVEGDETIAVSGTNGARTVNGASLTLTDDDSVTAANLVIDLSVDPASVTEDAGATTVTVTAEFSTVVTYATDTTVTVRVGAGGDSATSGTDYAAVADFTVTIPAGRTSGSAPFALTPTDDTLVEGDETIAVSGTNGARTVNGASLTLTDDDSVTAANLVIDLSVDPASVTEDAGATTVTVTAEFSTVVTYATDTTVTVRVGAGGDSATSGTDYAAVADFTVTIPAGRTSGSAPFALTPTDDTLVEGDETIAVSGTNGARTVNGASLTLTDDDSVTAANLVIDLSVDPASVTEDAGATTVTVTAEFSTVVTYATDTTVTVRVGAGGDSATSGTDYAAVADFTVTIPAGRTSGSAPFALTPTDDTLVEGDETIAVSGTNGARTVNGASLTLTDDDYSVALTVSDAQAEEGASMTFTVTLDNAVQGGFTVTPGFTDVTATEGTDYTENTTALSFSGTAGETRTFTVSTDEDAVLEANETFTVGLTVSDAPTGTTVTATDTGTGTIDDDDDATVTISDAQAEEGASMTFTVTLDNAVQGGFTVTPGFTDVTATEGTDYTENTTALSFSGTAGETQTFTVSTTEDEVVEGDETFTVGLSVSGAGVSPGAPATGTVTDDDAATVTVADASAQEGEVLAFVVTLDRAVAHDAVALRYATADGTATAGEDYEARSGALSFAPGETEATVTVPTLDDALDEGSETMTLRLSGAVNARLAEPEGTGTITNEDTLPRAWIARFGRTVAGHVMEAVDTRLHEDGSGSHLTLGGTVAWSGDSGAAWPESGVRTAGPGGFGDAAGWPGSAVRSAGPARWPGSDWNGAFGDDPLGTGHSRDGEREMEARELLSQSAFRWTSRAAEGDGASGSAPRWTAWGSGAATRFDGREGDLALDGEVVGVTLGLDAEWARWTAGMAFGWNDGRGAYADEKSGDHGKHESTLASVHPYARWSRGPVSVWGMLGHGQGEYVVTSERLGKAVRTDLAMHMVGVGARRALGPAPGDVELALLSDATFVWMLADGVPGYLRETSTRTSHVRLLLEGRRAFELGSGAVLTPSVEVGLRHDTGDAERGLGMELGGRVRYEDRARGLTVEAQGRGLLAHEAEDFETWGVSGYLVLDPGADGRGVSFSVRPAWGEPESGAAHLWEQGAARDGTQAADGDTPVRFDTALGYGVPALGGRGVFTVRGAVGWSSDGARTLSLGGTLDTDGAFELSLVGERTVPTDGEPEHGVMLRLSIAL